MLDPTRSTAHGFWRFAANYFLAAQTVDVRIKQEGNLYFPALYLYGIAIELSLKAFLLKRGKSLEQMKRLNHNLKDILALARRHKLGRVVRLARREREAILLLNYTYQTHLLRYIVTGTVRVPELIHVTRAAEELVTGLELLCTGTEGRLNR
jgi:hypothetical protein